MSWREEYRVTLASSGEEGLRLSLRDKPDLVVLDLMLPGIEICRRLKAAAATRSIPVVMVTAKGEDADVVVGLEPGADDYLTKPFSSKVLVARLRAVIRRREQEAVKDAKEQITRGDLLIHPGRREVLVDGSRVALELTFREFNILRMLAARPGWVYRPSQIAEALRGRCSHVTELSVDAHVLGLRRKLGSHGDLIATVCGLGYRFREEQALEIRATLVGRRAVGGLGGVAEDRPGRPAPRTPVSRQRPLTGALPPDAGGARTTRCTRRSNAKLTRSAHHFFREARSGRLRGRRPRFEQLPPRGGATPPEFSRPEVAKILMKYYQSTVA